MISYKTQYIFVFFFSSRRRHTRCSRDWSSDVCSSISALPNSTEVVGALAAGDAAGAHAKAQGWIYSGYKMTIFSTAEEQQREPLEIGGKVLFYPDFALRTAGGDVSVVAPWKSYVLQDRELISGQNPFSDEALLKLLLLALDGKKKSVSAA